MKVVKSADAQPKVARSFSDLPAVRALLLQVLSFLIVLPICIFLWRTFLIPIPPIAAAVLQGTCAALLSYRRGLASWWTGIQFLFPIVVVLALALQLPPSLFLIAFLVLLFLYWTTFRTQVPFYPSGRSVWNAVAEHLPATRGIVVVDIGSGLGGLTLNLSKRFPESRFTGVEIAPLPWLVSNVRARLSASTAAFIRGNYDNLQFSDYDVVFAYLSPAAMPALWQKAKAEMRKGSMLFSYEFEIPGVVPSTVIAPDTSGVNLYLFQMP